MKIDDLVKISKTLIAHHPNVGVSIVLNRHWIENTLFIELDNFHTVIWLSEFKSIRGFYRAVIKGLNYARK